MTKWLKRVLVVLILAAACSVSYLGGQAATRAVRVATWHAVGPGYPQVVYELVAVRDGTTVCYVVYGTNTSHGESPALSCVK